MAIEKYGAKHLVCPKCGNKAIFDVKTSGAMVVYVDGEGEIIDVDITYPDVTSSDRCQCLKCGHVNDFIIFEKPREETNG